MEELPQAHNNRKALYLVGLLMVITIAGAFIPASWFGIKTNNDTTLDLTSVDTIDATPKDKTTNQPLTWKQLTQQALNDQPELLANLESAPVDNVAISQLNDENNLTASFSKNLYIASAYLKDSGTTDDQSQQNVIAELMAQEEAKMTVKTYTYKDLKVAKSEDQASIKAYGNAIASLLVDVMTIKSLNEDLSSLDSYSKTKDGSTLVALKGDTRKVSELLKKMLAVSVPPSAVVYHLGALNQVSIYSQMLSDASTIETDPLRANLALKKYSTIIAANVTMFANLADYFNIKNVVFTGKEAAYIFTVGYTPK